MQLVSVREARMLWKMCAVGTENGLDGTPRGPSASSRRLTPEAVAEIALHAEETYPEECCGYVTGETVVRCRNAAWKRRIMYAIPIEDQLRALETDKRVTFYHSHADGPAELSPGDLAGLVEVGQPVHGPDVAFAVASVISGKFTGLNLFTWDGTGYAR